MQKVARPEGAKDAQCAPLKNSPSSDEGRGSSTRGSMDREVKLGEFNLPCSNEFDAEWPLSKFCVACTEREVREKVSLLVVTETKCTRTTGSLILTA